MAETQNIDIQITIENLVVDVDSYTQENVRKELMEKLIGWTQSQLVPHLGTQPQTGITVRLSFPNNVHFNSSALV